MSDVTVQYKGNTIKQFSENAEETLDTKATWMEDDLKIKALWSYLGAGAELVSNFADFSVALKDTDFNTWTPSTTATAILATDTFGTFAADMKNYDYVIKWTFWTDLKYNAGATLKVMPYKQRSISISSTCRRPRYYSDFQAETFNYNLASSNEYTAAILYYNSSGSLAVHQTGSYGFYATASTATLSSATADTPTVTIPRPVLYARCSTTYFATARASEIDKTNSKLYLRCEVFRVKKDYTKSAEWREMVAAMNE